MNGKKAKIIRKKAKTLMLDWLISVVDDSEKEKVNINNLEEYLPDQTHIYANRHLRVSAYTLRWFIKGIKNISRTNKKSIHSIKFKDIENA